MSFSDIQQIQGQTALYETVSGGKNAIKRKTIQPEIIILSQINITLEGKITSSLEPLCPMQQEWEKNKENKRKCYALKMLVCIHSFIWCLCGEVHTEVRTTQRSQFCLSPTRFLGIQVRSSDLVASTKSLYLYTSNHLTRPLLHF